MFRVFDPSVCIIRNYFVRIESRGRLLAILVAHKLGATNGTHVGQTLHTLLTKEAVLARGQHCVSPALTAQSAGVLLNPLPLQNVQLDPLGQDRSPAQRWVIAI